MKALFLLVLLSSCTTLKPIESKDLRPQYPKFSYHEKVCIVKGFYKGACGVIEAYREYNDVYVYSMIETKGDKTETYRWLYEYEFDYDNNN